MNFLCGHTQPDPRNMGRGMRRQARLNDFFSRNCLDCRMKAEDAFEASLTRPRTPEQSATVRAKIISSYK